jgi:hypothetical protein
MLQFQRRSRFLGRHNDSERKLATRFGGGRVLEMVLLVACSACVDDWNYYVSVVAICCVLVSMVLPLNRTLCIIAYILVFVQSSLANKFIGDSLRSPLPILFRIA